MKSLNKILVGIGIGVALMLMVIIFNYGKKLGLSESLLVVQKHDSLLAVIDSIESLPPVVEIDTFWKEADPIVKWYPKYIDKPVVEDKEFSFQDSLVTDEVAIYINDLTVAKPSYRNIGYQLFVPKQITIVKDSITKVPVYVPTETVKYYNGIFVGAEVGGGSQFAYSVSGGYSLQQHRFGLEYLRFGGTNNWMLKYEYLIIPKK